MLGIENLKKLVKLSVSFAMQIVESASDGKFTITDSFSFIDELAQIPGVVTSWPDIAAELKDLDEAERVELHAYLSGEFDIPNDKIEGIVEDAVLEAIHLVSLYGKIKALKDAA